MLRAIRVARIEQNDHAIDFVEHLLEPQLVDLVNDDEEHFVMFGSLGARPLQLEQLVNREVTAVGEVGSASNRVRKKSRKDAAMVLPANA